MRTVLQVALAVQVMIGSPLPVIAQVHRPDALASIAGPTGFQAMDGRRTSGLFVQNLGRNTADLFSHDNVRPFLIGGSVALVGTIFDQRVRGHLAPARRMRWLGDLADMTGHPRLVAPATAVIYGLGRLSHHQRLRDATYDAAQATLISVACTMTIKYVTIRMRPDSSDHLSFPSGHTSNAFVWATVANHYYGPGAGVPAFLVAGLIGAGRMEKNVHYFSDVVAGATLGYIVAQTAIRKTGAPPGAGTVAPGTAPARRLPPITLVSFQF